MIFKFYTVYNKHEMIKIGSQAREKLQVSSQVFIVGINIHVESNIFY